MADSQVFYAIIKSELFKRDDRPVKISKPQILDIMLKENGEFITPKKLKYFRHPVPSAFPLDLNLGYEDYKHRSDDYFNTTASKLEKYLMENNGRVLLKDTSKQRICTTRNVLKDLMKTSFCLYSNSHNNWTINAIKFQDVIYLIKNKEKPETRGEVNTYHFKFHQYCFSDTPYRRPDTDKPIDENEQMSCIFQTNVDDFELLYSAEIVGVESRNAIKDIKDLNTLNNCRFVVTKLLLEKHNNHRYQWKKHPKFFDTWIQSFLTRVDTVYVGFRTEDGIVNKNLERIETRSIPKGQRWVPEICKRFLRNFLNKVQRKLGNTDCPYTVFQFNFDSALQMVKCRVFEGKTEHSFLSEEFIQYLQKK